MQSLYLFGHTFGVSVLFHWSVYLFLVIEHTILIKFYLFIFNYSFKINILINILIKSFY